MFTSRLLLCQVVLCGLATAQVNPDYRVRVFAGGGLPDGLPGLSASLGRVSSVAAGPAGSVYIALSDVPVVYRLDSNGILTRMAGTGVVGFSGDGGPAVDAELSDYDTIALAPDGTLYISDLWNGRIRKVANGIIATVTGGGALNGDGVPATSALLNTPTGLALDSGGNLYFAEQDNHRVRRVSGGTITTVAGNGSPGFGGDGGPGTSATLNFPTGVAVDAAGNIYIADSQNDRIRKVSAGIITTFAGTGTPGHSGDGGPAEQAQLNLAVNSAIAVDAAGDLYITDWLYVRKVTNGVIATVAGVGPGGTALGSGASALQFPLAGPSSVAAGPGSNFYIADLGMDWGRINGGIVIEVSQGLATAIAGGGSHLGDGGPARAGQLYGPSAIAVDRSGAVYIADNWNSRIRMVKDRKLTTVAGTSQNPIGPGDSNGSPAVDAVLMYPTTVTTDASGNIYFADGGTGGYIRKVTQGVFNTIAGNGPGPEYYPGAVEIGGSSNIGGLVASSNGDLYIAEPGNQRVWKLSDGILTVAAGYGTAGYSGDSGPAEDAQLNFPSGLALDSAGSLYIADEFNGVIRKVSSGTITTVAGPFSDPLAVAVDGHGDLFVVGDPFVDRVSNGVITTIAKGTISAPDDGVPPSAQLGWWAAGVAVDGAGNVYVADAINNRILVFTPFRNDREPLVRLRQPTANSAPPVQPAR